MVTVATGGGGSSGEMVGIAAALTDCIVFEYFFYL